MNRKTFLSTVAASSLAPAGRPTPVKIIFDTDLESDVDDVGSVALLHALADRGECEILAMGVSASQLACAPCLDALNTWFRRPQIPIGVVKGKSVPPRKSKYAAIVAEEFPHQLKSSADASDAVTVYRAALEKQRDQSVTMVSVGYLTNFRNLLVADGGMALVRRKVKLWVCMGGTFPKGREWNLHNDAEAAALAIANWPTPIVFSGFEIGKEVFTGARLSETPAISPVRRAYELYNGLKNRESWDQTAVFFAVRGAGEFWTLSSSGTVRIAPDGGNDWRDDANGTHRHLIKQFPPSEVAARIEALMLHQPKP